jgi:hypothetical protein
MSCQLLLPKEIIDVINLFFPLCKIRYRSGRRTKRANQNPTLIRSEGLDLQILNSRKKNARFGIICHEKMRHAFSKSKRAQAGLTIKWWNPL